MFIKYSAVEETFSENRRIDLVSYHPRIESKDYASFLTTRSRNSELWFVNNQPLENAILGYAAKFANRHSVQLYALAIEGNHIQAPAAFPKENRADFMRDLNSCVAKAVDRLTPEYPGGRFWARRYSSEFLAGDEDIEDYFFYTVLQPIQDGLVEKLSDYPGYNCFHDAVYGITRTFKVIDWAKYNAAKRFDSTVSILKYTQDVTLEYTRLPGYEHLSQKEYAKLMHEKLEGRRLELVAKRYKEGLGFAGRDNLLKTPRGARPKNTKTSTAQSHRPRVLSACPKRGAACRAWYFSNYFDYKEASKLYREGNLDVTFPPGTYRPWLKYHPPPP